MMLDKDINDIIEAKPDRSPIFYGSIEYRVKINRKLYPFRADKIVMKGTTAEILKDERVIRSVLVKYLGDDKAAKKKARDFDLDKIELFKIHFKKFLGYGIKFD